VQPSDLALATLQRFLDARPLFPHCSYLFAKTLEWMLLHAGIFVSFHLICPYRYILTSEWGCTPALLVLLCHAERIDYSHPAPSRTRLSSCASLFSRTRDRKDAGMLAIEHETYRSSEILQRQPIETHRNAARVVGVLFIIGTVAGILSVLFIQPLFDDPNYLVRLSTNGNPIIIGSLLVLTMGLALAFVPFVIFPVLKRYNEAFALGYVVFRGALETVTCIAVVVGWMLLLPVSQAYVQAGAADAATYQALGAVLRKEAEIASAIGSIVFPLGAMMLYTVLYQSKLIPRWISLWGLVGVALYLVGLGVGGLFTFASGPLPIQDVLALPTLAQEMVMAGWLILRGFDQAALATA
jgi:hypothetical protein